MPAARTLAPGSRLGPAGQRQTSPAAASSAPPTAVAAPRVHGGIGGVPTLFALVLLLLSPLTANPMLTATAVASLALITRLLWRPGLPPVLLFVCGMQWLQGALEVFHADVLGVELWTLTQARHIEAAAYLTLGWVTMLAVGIWLAMRTLDVRRVPSLLDSPISAPRLLALYAGWSLLVFVVKSLSVAALAQVVQALSVLRWAVVFVIFAWGWAGRRERIVALAVLCLETLLGFLSFFSDFKIALFLFAIAVLTVGRQPTVRQYAAFAVVFSMTLYLGILWSAIKLEYRDRLSGGLGQQTQQVVLSTEETFEQFVDLIGTVDSGTLEQGAEKLVERIAYIEYFAYVLDYVPALRDHEDGKLWLGAVKHVLTPRVFFPDKAVLESDTAVAERYTGLSLGVNSGTSITIGLPAETYVDVGYYGMFMISLLLGLLYGSGMRYLTTRSRSGVFACGIAVAANIGMLTVGASAAKELGGYLAVFIVSALVLFAVGPQIARFLGDQPPAPAA